MPAFMLNGYGPLGNEIRGLCGPDTFKLVRCYVLDSKVVLTVGTECLLMSSYRDELVEAQRQGKAAHDAMEAWVSRPLDAPEIPGEILEGYGRELRESRERLKRLIREQGVRDDIEAALAANEEYHRSLGLSIRDKPDPVDEV